MSKRLFIRALNAFRASLAALLRVGEARKPEIYAEVSRSAELAELNYWLELVFAVGIATLGLIINSPAVVIGGMLISPLMGPITAAGLALELGDFYLGLKASANIVLSIVVSVALAAGLTWVLPFHTPTPEILARVQPTILDLAVAVLSGLAGAVVICRRGLGGGVAALPGVAVAVALVPPLAVIGFGIGVGWDGPITRGGGLLFLTNLVAIILSSFVVFFAIRMDSSAVRTTINEWAREHKQGDRLYQMIERTPVRQLLGHIGSLPRRLAVLVLFLGLVMLPLQQTLVRLKHEAQIRRVVRLELNKSIPRDATFREDIQFIGDVVRIRVAAVLPKTWSAEQRLGLQQTLEAATERAVQFDLVEVPTRDELRAVGAAAPSIATVGDLRKRLLERVGPAVTAAWPIAAAPLVGYSLTIAPGEAGVEVHIAFLGADDLGEFGRLAVQKSIQDRAGTTTAVVSVERIPDTWSIDFARGSDALAAADTRALETLAALLRRFDRLVCDVAAGPASLERRRADRIQTYLTETLGITAGRIRRPPSDAAAPRVRLAVAEPPAAAAPSR